MEQVLRADRELLTIMAQEHSGPFVNEPRGKQLPLDILMGQLAHDPRISKQPQPGHLPREENLTKGKQSNNACKIAIATI